MKHLFYYNQSDTFFLGKHNEDGLIILESDILTKPYILKPFINIEHNEEGIDIYYTTKKGILKHTGHILLSNAYDLLDLIDDNHTSFLDWDEINERINIAQIVIEHIIENIEIN